MFTVVCYGDSNTHGADPHTLQRFPRDVRWTGVLGAQLAGHSVVVEEGLNGRTTVWDDPFGEGRNGRSYLLPCLRSHAPVDLLVLMLGTNDLKSIYGRKPQEIAAGAGTLVDIALASGSGPRGGRPGVLLLAPPRLGEATERAELWGYGEARAKSEELPRLYRLLAELKQVAFLDASAIVAGAEDGIHLDEAGHGLLGRAVAAGVRDALG